MYHIYYIDEIHLKTIEGQKKYTPSIIIVGQECSG